MLPQGKICRFSTKGFFSLQIIYKFFTTQLQTVSRDQRSPAGLSTLIGGPSALIGGPSALIGGISASAICGEPLLYNAPLEVRHHTSHDEVVHSSAAGGSPADPPRCRYRCRT